MEPQLEPGSADLVDWLLKGGFVVSASRFDEELFGNVLVHLERGNLRVRVTRDRSQWFLDVAGPSGRWYDMELWRASLDGVLPSIELARFEDNASYLKEAMSRIEQALRLDEALEDRLRSNGEERVRLLKSRKAQVNDPDLQILITVELFAEAVSVITARPTDGEHSVMHAIACGLSQNAVVRRSGMEVTPAIPRLDSGPFHLTVGSDKRYMIAVDGRYWRSGETEEKVMHGDMAGLAGLDATRRLHLIWAVDDFSEDRAKDLIAAESHEHLSRQRFERIAQCRGLSLVLFAHKATKRGFVGIGLFGIRV